MPIEPKEEPAVVIAIDYSPATNPKAIALIEQADGNWKGYKQINGKLEEVRMVSPEYCLQALQTHQ